MLGMSAHGDECEDSRVRMAKMSVEGITLVNDTGRLKSIDTHVARSNETRAAGYQHICEAMVERTTILFVYPKEHLGRFHMQNVRVPLDIGFFDSEGRLLKVMLMDTYKDGNRKLYDPGVPFQYALEAPEGFFRGHKLSQGRSRLVLHSVNDLL